MIIKFFRSIWGMEEPTLEKKLKKIKQAGFNGVEMMVTLEKAGQNELGALLRDLELELIASQWAAIGNTFKEYLESFEAHLYANAQLNPLFSNSQTGKVLLLPGTNKSVNSTGRSNCARNRGTGSARNAPGKIYFSHA